MTDSKTNSKEILAKLMATENITVEHANISTAAFDLKNRKLLLPVWKEISDDVYTLLISHEVGHALYTPYSEWSNSIAGPQSDDLKNIINIVEDVRIEKLIQNKFPGTIKSFKVGYNELEAKNIFGTKERTIDSYQFLDRINLHFKLGHFGYVKVPFADDESFWLNKIASCNTFSEVVRISKELLEFINSQQSEQNSNSENSQSSQDSPSSDNLETQSNSNKSDSSEDSLEKSSSSSSSDSNSENSENSENTSSDSNSSSKSEEAARNVSSGSSVSESKSNGKIESETQSSFDSSIQKYVDNNVSEVCYATLPNIDLKQIVVDYKTVHSQIKDFYTSRYAEKYEEMKSQVESYKSSNKTIVNQLASIFEMKKRAKMDARILVSRTGKLDNNRVFSYRYNDDIFKKHTVIPEGKSHGLVMFLDMSGSMNNNMEGTYDQMLNLVLFCRRINIPFDVYGFTDSYNPGHIRNYKSGDLTFDSYFSLRQYFSNTMTAAEFNEALHNILMLKNSYRNSSGYYTHGVVPPQEVLNKTPMIPAIITATKLVPEFRKKYSLDIVNVIFLSDGEDTHGTAMLKKDEHGVDRLVDITKMGSWTWRNGNKRFYIVDSKTKKQWEITDSTKTCLEILKQVAGVRIIGFHIISKRELKGKFESLKQKNVSEKLQQFKTNKYYEINNAEGYDAYYLLPSDKGLNINSSEFDPVVDSTVDWDDQKQAKRTMKAVAKDFSNFMKQKVVNRVLLTRFIEQIS